MGDASGRIELVVRPMVVQVIFWPSLLWPPLVILDGQRRRGWWFRRITVDAPPGVRTVLVKQFFHNGATRVLVEAGETTKAVYSYRWIRGLEERIRVRVGIQCVSECYGYKVGARVQHQVHGSGTIHSIEVRDEGISSFAEIRFDDAGVQRVDLDVEGLVPS